MRFGANIFEEYNTPEQWLAIVQRKGLRAVYNPVKKPDDLGEIQAYVDLCKENDLVIAEVGAWGHSFVSREVAKREAAFEHAKNCLILAERLGARTCVNVSGAVEGVWDGVHKDNFTEETHALVVSTMQRLLDTVQPQKTSFSLEPMPWMIPDSTESYERLVKDIDRAHFGVHYDPVNMINSHRLYANNGEFMTDFIARLGSHICSVHMKDVLMKPDYNTVILEKQPGQGELDYKALLSALLTLDPDLPVMTEHMNCEEDSMRAEIYIKKQAAEIGITL